MPAPIPTNEEDSIVDCDLHDLVGNPGVACVPGSCFLLAAGVLT